MGVRDAHHRRPSLRRRMSASHALVRIPAFVRAGRQEVVLLASNRVEVACGAAALTVHVASASRELCDAHSLCVSRHLHALRRRLRVQGLVSSVRDGLERPSLDVQRRALVLLPLQRYWHPSVLLAGEKFGSGPPLAPR